MKAITDAFSDLDELVRSCSPPQIRLVPDPVTVMPGESCRLSWVVGNADEVRLWHTEVRPATSEPLDWNRVFEEGRPVRAEDERKLQLVDDTAFFLVARAGSTMRGERVLVEIRRETEGVEGKVGCAPTERMLEKMAFTPHVALPGGMDWEGWRPKLIGPLEVEWRHLWFAPPAPPGVTLSTPMPVIFTDETATVSWTVADTNCVSNGTTISVTRLLPDPTNPSGSKYDGGGWGAGWSVACAGANPGSRIIEGKQGSRHTVVHVHASNASGKSAASSQWIDTLSLPKFEGTCTATRQAAIRAALKTMDTRLREGRVLYDGYLDTTVKAFKKGCLNRQGIWSRLLDELQNMDITPIKCEDTQDPKAATGSFEPYTGRVYLRWKPTVGPNLDYVLCHELVHKAGFHQNLYPCGLSQADIECDADHIASAILGLQPDPC